MSNRPLLIGASPRILHRVPAELGFHDKSLQYMEQSVAHWVMSLGASCVMLPTVERGGMVRRSEIQVNDLVQLIDGLVLQGGSDVEPQWYGQQPEHLVGDTDPVRDRFELDLIHAFIKAGKPVLGICRGMQLINVALGGTLYQDLVALGVTSYSHVDTGRYDRHHHPLVIEPDSVMAGWYGGATQGVINSIHHQGVARLGEGLRVVARAPDGVVEAIWREGPGFVFGAQWHPEFHDGSDASLMDPDPIMRAFLDAARQRRDGSGVPAAVAL
ncbi:gamma-glutamyl-gamma-aminobutyrate hydrolase family protein [Denitratimonas sp. CY0512]|uniref:gamma-glutamyl-gamma-aminobutyrate hydrolase family protein n=1 Tax=Denitratimonas sp. CY0512 TaxID=3131940 RepID=UPI003095354B